MCITTTGYEIKIDTEGMSEEILEKIDAEILSGKYDIYNYRQTCWAAYIRFKDKESELAFILANK